MTDLYVVLSKIIEEQKLEVISTPEGYRDIRVHVPEVNRPGLQLLGFFDYFDPERIQVIGKIEYTYLKKMNSDERYKALKSFFSLKPVAVVVTRALEIFPEMELAAKENSVPLLRSAEVTSQFMSNLILSLNVSLAPMTTCHGVLVEVYGEGILLLGESGVGKSETAMELVKRGHRLVADDAVEIRKVSKKTLVGSSPAIIRHFILLSCLPRL